jgi:SAM-dependent methyltransferase
MFLRKTRVERDPLAVTMSGVRLGERALQIGNGDARVMALIAAKTGLTGTAMIVLLDEHAAARVRRAIDDTGAVAEVGVVDQGPPPDDASFDVIVAHDVPNTIAATNPAVRSGWLQQCYRVLRDGGRIVTIEPGSPVGFRAWFGSKDVGVPGRAGSEAALASAGFRGLRVLGDREGLRFVEGFKTR